MSEKAQKLRQEQTRVLLVSCENLEARRLVTIFTENNFDILWISRIEEAKKMCLNWKPRVIISDLLLNNSGGTSGLELIDFIKNSKALSSRNISTIILSSHPSPGNLDESLRRGANDYLTRPFMHQELINRVILQCREPLDIDDQKWQSDEGLGIDALLAIASSNDKIELIMHKVSQLVAQKIGSVRCSLIRTITTSEALVFASSDKADIAGLRIDLSAYPEVQLVANTKKMIAINDLSSSRALKHIQGKVKSIQFSAMIVAPVYYKQRFFGVISARLPSSTKKVKEEDIRLVSMAAKIASLCISGRGAEELGQFGLISAS